MPSKLRHDDLVQAIRTLAAYRPSFVSDDMDQYYDRVAGISPMIRDTEDGIARRDKARVLAARLIDIGAEAADAVAKGLRMQGTWREHLLPYARAHRNLAIVREAVALVAKRTRDPLAAEARRILAAAQP